MRKEKTVSKYTVNSLAAKSKQIYSRLFDYFLALIASLTLVAIALPISTNFQISKDIYADLEATTKQMVEYIDSTGLQKYNQDKTGLLTINEEADSYLRNLAKTSAYVHDIKFPYLKDDGTYEFKEVKREETFIADGYDFKMDNISYYYQIFKPSVKELDDYNGKKYEEMTYEEVEKYQYLTVMKLKETDYVTIDDADYLNKGEGISRFVVLTLANTKQIIKFYQNDKNNVTLYNSIYQSYAQGIMAGIDEVEAKSPTYLALQNTFDFHYQRISRLYIVLFFIVYLIAYLALTVPICLVSKEWTTIGQKTMKLGMCEVGETNPSVLKMILYHLINFILFSTGCLLIFYLLGMIGVTSLVVIPHITFLAIMIFILVLNVASLFMPLMNKNGYNLSTLFLKLILKDKQEFDVPIGLDITDEVKEESNENGSSVH